MSMQHGIGVKEVFYCPMTRGEYNDYRRWSYPAGEDQLVPGYLVEYKDGGEKNHPDHAGYISWSPADVFDNAYRPTSGMSFGLAIEAMKRGHRVARKGWNGRGICIFLEKGAEGSHGDLKLICYGPFIAIDTTGLITNNPDAPKSIVPWLASQTDMLSDDWVVIS